MNVAINAYSAKVGGGKTYLYNLLRNLPGEGLRIYLFCNDDLDVPETPNVIRVKVSFPVYHPVMRWFWERLFFVFWLRKFDIDVLFVPGGVVNTKAPDGCRVVTMFRNMLPFDDVILAESGFTFLRVKNWLLRRGMLRSMAAADLVIFISEYARGVVEKYISIKSSVTIPHGIADDFFVANRDLPRPKLPFGEPYILYVSRFEFYKRHLELVKAYELLSASIRSKYKLLIVGGHDTSAGQVVKSYIAYKNLGNDIYLIGDYPYKDLPALYRNSELFAFVSACENCPNILLEAMGSGSPIICSNYQPMPEFGGDAVVYVSPDDPEDLSLKIFELLDSERLSDNLSGDILNRGKNYTWEVTAKRTWKSILSI